MNNNNNHINKLIQINARLLAARRARLCKPIKI